MMRVVQVKDFTTWRASARASLADHVSPASVSFTDGSQETLFESDESSLPHHDEAAAFSVPRSFLELAEFIAMHRDPKRWDLLYRVLYRIVCLHERHLLDLEVDPDVRELTIMRKAIARDIHKMHAFVRFRKVEGEIEQFVAWHKPDHHIVEHVGPWFARRFGAMQWAILTPDRSVSWDLQKLHFGPGVPRSDAPQGDMLEDLWRSYYKSIFNPARLNVAAMKKELPVRHWATLPEAELIPKLVSEAKQREIDMRDTQPSTAQEFLPKNHNLPTLAAAVRKCQGCDLYRLATQAVFGEGPAKAEVMFVGEQPGDQEDIKGKPFVGPAGQLWNKALHEAGLDRAKVYVTNAVKHFKFEERGKRRIHKKPNGGEIAACHPWLDAEIEAVNPKIIVALGATAALSVGGREFAIQKERGKFLTLANGRTFMITVHPSFLLRVPDESKEAEFAHFVEDLRLLV